jgi:hypothetical protein
METKKPWYDDPDYLSNFLAKTGLEGLTLLIKARRETNQAETDLLLFGQMVVTWKGEVITILRSMPKNDYPAIPDVLPDDQWAPYFKGIHDRLVVSQHLNLLPHHLLRCPYCGLGWSLKNVLDFRTLRDNFLLPLDQDAGKTFGYILGREVEPKADAIYLPNPDRNCLIDNRGRAFAKYLDTHGFADGKAKEKYMDGYVIQIGERLSLQRYYFFHEKCLKSHKIEKRTASLQNLFDQAGYKNIIIRLISNSNHPDLGSVMTWHVRTDFGSIMVDGFGDSLCWKVDRCEDKNFTFSPIDWGEGKDVQRNGAIDYLQSLMGLKKRTKR